MSRILTVTLVFLLASCGCLAGKWQQKDPPSATEVVPSQPTLSSPPPTAGDKALQVLSMDWVSFTLPEGWKVTPEHWPSANPGKKYMNQALEPLGEIGPGAYTPKVIFTHLPLPPGSSLEAEFERLYKTGGIYRDVSQGTMEVDGKPAVVREYQHPLGEPWYQFKDVWVENNGEIFVIACRMKLQAPEKDRQQIETILKSIHFR